ASLLWSVGRMQDVTEGVYQFFFSSRRRHTRSKRDWSSDVCSSDLLLDQHRRPQLLPLEALRRDAGLGPPRHQLVAGRPLAAGDRSEERRVGKEWMLRRTPGCK